MNKIRPCLWFDGQAEEAARFYVSLFENARLGHIAHYGESASAGSGQPKGSVMTVAFEIKGQGFLALNGGPHFTFSPATSFFIHCGSDEEITSLWDRLSQGGDVLMPLDAYPFSEKYGWVQDRFGLSWQLILAESAQKIAPCLLFVGDRFAQAEEAMNFYISQFEKSGVVMIDRYQSGEPGPEGTVKYAKFTLAGQEFVVLDGPGEHNFAFSPAVSFMVNCETQSEIDRFWENLSEGGREDQCGWLQDRFGVSWQVVPQAIVDWIGRGTPAQMERLMSAVLGMRKLDIARLHEAFSTESADTPDKAGAR